MTIELDSVDIERISAGLANLSVGLNLISTALIKKGDGWKVTTEPRKQERTEEAKPAETAAPAKEEPKADEPKAVEKKPDEPAKADPKETAAKLRRIFARAVKKDRPAAKAVLARFGASITDVEQNHPEKLDALYDEAVSAFGEEE